MADEADRAQALIALALRAGLSRAAQRAAGPPPAGLCLWCAAPLAAGERWCDAECRDDWQHHREREHAGPDHL